MEGRWTESETNRKIQREGRQRERQRGLEWSRQKDKISGVTGDGAMVWRVRAATGHQMK